jgi:hypothetical protein
LIRIATRDSSKNSVAPANKASSRYSFSKLAE